MTAPEHEPLSPIGVRELRNQVASVIRRAGSGERLVVTVDGRPMAQLGPLTPDHDGVTLWDLAAAGMIEPPVRTRPSPDDPAAGGVSPTDPAPIPLPADLSANRLLQAARGR